MEKTGECELTFGQIRRAVRMGKLDTASELANGDVYHLCALIEELYVQGYVDASKAWLSRLDPLRLSEAKPPYREAAFIYAEIMHDEGRYDEAAAIFEKLADDSHYMSKARFGASSCYLHSTMNRLLGRLEIYRPGEEELIKIEKYLHDISAALQIIHRTNWHTVWNEEQSRNILRPLQAVIQ
ncbi:tetratricopeptide repeat protein [Paenibacillus sp. DYY-L-2]|uniref:tetratricopeptide repeat protein n=1 Tax=Paenibacillus sp. DYY-L-2 TaxID=3447013 RepID=UPI003F507208